MKVTVFAKKMTSKEGKPFVKYVARLPKKDGTELTAAIRFREECGSPRADDCPCNIEFAKEDANLASENYVREDTGEEATAYKLWVSAWRMSDDIYVDHSLDDFED